MSFLPSGARVPHRYYNDLEHSRLRAMEELDRVRRRRR